MITFTTDQILSFITSPFIAAPIGYILGQFLPGFSKEFFDERARRKRHKIEVAIQVHKICNEASTGNYKLTPRSQEHVNSILTDLAGISEEMENEMLTFINLWRLIRDFNTEANSVEGKKYYMELNMKIEPKRKKLTSWANKIRS